MDQAFFIGIDTHLKSWTVTVNSLGMELERFRMSPIPEQLALHMNKKYPEGDYYSVYEAGFGGFWIHFKLVGLGFNNIVVNPADVPTTDKEKSQKTDPRDSRKLSRELSKNNLVPIHIQSLEDQTLKSLCRYRLTLGSDMTRIKNRITGYLYLFGINISEETKWTGAFIEKLYRTAEKIPNGETLKRMTDTLKYKKQETLSVNKDLRDAIKRSGKFKLLQLLRSIPGIGFLTAATLITEIIDIYRFTNFNQLLSFVGLAPWLEASGEKEIVKGLSKRRNKYIMKMLVEASWIAVRKDPTLLQAFCKLSKRMKKQKAILRIAKKVLNRVKAVWLKQEAYKICYNN